MTSNGNDPTATSQFSALSGSPDTGELDARRVGMSEQDFAAVQALPPFSALLLVQRGPNQGARFLLDSESTMAGRHPKSDIFLDDVTVSRQHCEFLRHEGTFYVRDHGSLNGTYVNRERIDEVGLVTGDEVQIGKYRMTFHASPNRAQ
ncbi:MAG: FHA domain-containing protein [Flaviflexus sp.]|uniref:FHA domain-containing protein n=1 Tax=Flaviflexus ciconiae TaxID=2496867 RepID=A0A3Q9G3G2_9ACTO|nr:FHA domain-containing protein [Flaviflexus ciconiae]AZQ76562.1 FHA domain-containing protein [Flaviflexus ciconiae]